jgi:hypothetical protein
MKKVDLQALKIELVRFTSPEIIANGVMSQRDVTVVLKISATVTFPDIANGV